MKVLFAMEAKRYGEICPHAVQVIDSLVAFVALGIGEMRLQIDMDSTGCYTSSCL